jgi:hypothetical protein
MHHSALALSHVAVPCRGLYGSACADNAMKDFNPFRVLRHTQLGLPMLIWMVASIADDMRGRFQQPPTNDLDIGYCHRP